VLCCAAAVAVALALSSPTASDAAAAPVALELGAGVATTAGLYARRPGLSGAGPAFDARFLLLDGALFVDVIARAGLPVIGVDVSARQVASGTDNDGANGEAMIDVGAAWRPLDDVVLAMGAGPWAGLLPAPRGYLGVDVAARAQLLTFSPLRLELRVDVPVGATAAGEPYVGGAVSLVASVLLL
jgi:hypothetical protein